MSSSTRPRRPRRSDRPGSGALNILPADAKLADAALLLADQLGRERRLRSALGGLDDYDLVVIDAAPRCPW